ncbi:BatD family protein [Sulfurimonas sp. HSL-3221]|uniref:BatD family protein n=1 Tax=Sulfurimonadaceae TaxID=2771471 RepID=UPI001E3B9377|nr:BatD family protein [Sulfurimonas sp. HSL-3221]UFS62797.1 BatD family protein [Sulfurimonas sp. HSL-3221]
MMTKRPLGKILALLLVGLPLFAAVTATVDNPAVTRGDPVTLTLSATGDDIRFPALTEIAGYPIQSRGTSRNISIVNGRTTRAVEQRLVFTPTEDTAIPALDITVDGTVEHTLPLHVKVVAPQAAAKGAPVQMLLHLSKEDAYVGEPVELDLVFKYLPGERIDDIRISEPTLEHFWIKRINTQAERSADSEGYITQSYRYLLFPQQSGDLEIPAIFAQIGTKVSTGRGGMSGDPFFNDPFFGAARMQYRKVYSEQETLHVTALPQGLEVYGRFTMHADIDKASVDANKPVNLHIHIEGNGNVEDIPKFDPHFAHAIVYANDPKTTSTLQDGKYFGTFDQTIAIIPDRDLTVTPQSFRYFDAKTAQPATLQTPPFFIKVKGAAPVPAAAAAPHVETAAPSKAAAVQTPTVPDGSRFSPFEALGIFAAGAAAGVLSFWLLLLRGRDRLPKKRELPPMVKRVKAAKSDRTLFELLLPLKGSAKPIDDALAQLEANLYRGADHAVDRKALADYFGGQTGEDVALI